MCNASLQHFCNRIADAGRISADDVAVLGRELLPDGITCRDEADLLLALDRTVDSDARFSDFLIAAIVDFTVWGERPTGTITRESAEWLAVTIRGRSGPTRTGARLAMEIVREANTSDEALIAFALEANDWTRAPAKVLRRPLPLAA